MRVRAALIVAALLAVLAPLTAAPASANTSPVQFYVIYYNSPGADTGSNASVNSEYVVVKNYSHATTYNLYRWTVRDTSSHVYTFASTFYLRPGATVIIRTGHGTNTTTTRYWGLDYYVWNNDTDTAFLRTGSGTQLDICGYHSSGGSVSTACAT